jgi:hypothetical protein
MGPLFIRYRKDREPADFGRFVPLGEIGGSSNTAMWHFAMPTGGPSTTSTPDILFSESSRAGPSVSQFVDQ